MTYKPKTKMFIFGMFVIFISVLIALLVYSLYFNIGLRGKIKQTPKGVALEIENVSNHEIKNVVIVGDGFRQEIKTLKPDEKKLIDLPFEEGEREVWIRADFHQPINLSFNIQQTAGEIKSEILGESSFSVGETIKQTLRVCSSNPQTVEIEIFSEGLEHIVGGVRKKTFTLEIKERCKERDLFFKGLEKGVFLIRILIKYEEEEKILNKEILIV